MLPFIRYIAQAVPAVCSLTFLLHVGWGNNTQSYLRSHTQEARATTPLLKERDHFQGSLSRNPDSLADLFLSAALEAYKRPTGLDPQGLINTVATAGPQSQ